MSDKLVVTADSTQITDFLTCERLWKYSHDERLTPSRDMTLVESKPAMLMGTLGHAYLERYYKCLAVGGKQSAALENSLAFNPDVQVCTCGHQLQAHQDVVLAVANNGIPLCDEVDCMCSGWKPKPFELDKPNRAVVAQRFREYCYTYSNGNDIIPKSPDSVEVGFSECLYEDDEHLFILEGRIDLIGTLSGQPCIMDHKFQLREKALYKKAIQFRNYAMVTGSNMMILNMIRLAKQVTNHTFQRDIASFTQEEHRWWRHELIDIFRRMASARLIGRWEQNWSSCSGRYGYECDYTKLCEETNQDLIQIKKDTMYQIKPEWKPW